MAASHDAALQGGHGHDHGSHGHGSHGHGSHSHGSRRSYMIGFLASVVLTAIPFWLVMTGVLNSVPATALTIFAFALVQIVVHVMLFLHVDTRVEGGWTLISFMFTVVIVAITIGGSVWIMYHLDTNMMPPPVGLSGG